MAGDASAYAALGISPDADAAAVEQAYRNLIKQHHPDRAGGDAARAAEINWAYHELKGQRPGKNLLVLNPDEPPDLAARRRFGTRLALALAVGAGVTGIVLASPVRPWFHRLAGNATPIASALASGDAEAGEPMDVPLAAPAIGQAIVEAVRISRTRDEMALAGASRDCHAKLRLRPTIAQLDRCAAFDDAVVQLQDRDPLRDQGPFSELAVTGRQMNGASALSDNALAIDSRLDRIRLQVELALAAPLPPPPTPPPEDTFDNDD